VRPDFGLVRLPVRNDRRKSLCPQNRPQEGTLRAAIKHEKCTSARHLPYTMVGSFPIVAMLRS